MTNSIKRSYIRFTANTPVDVTLDYGPEGKVKESTTDPGAVDWQYTVNGNTALMYLPAAARSQLLRTGAQAGDTIRILKCGAGKDAPWTVEVLSDAHEHEPEPPPVAPQTTRRAPVTAMPSRTTSAPAYQRSAAAVAPQPAASQPASGSMVDLMATCFVLAARALGKAHTEIATHPEWHDLEPPTWDDIRSCAASLFIERNKQLRDGSR